MTRLASSVLHLSVVTALALLACTSESSTPTPVAAAEPSASETGTAAAEAEAGVPKIACADAVYDFGAVKPTDKIEHIFKITNEGTADLKIERVQKT